MWKKKKFKDLVFSNFIQVIFNYWKVFKKEKNDKKNYFLI